MARVRFLKPGFFTNDKLAEVEPLGRLLFAGLWTIADREGRLEDRPKKIKAELLPYDNCDVDNLLQQLHNKGFIIRYSHNGESYISIVNFGKHQTPHLKEQASVIPKPDKNDASIRHASDMSQASIRHASDKNDTCHADPDPDPCTDQVQSSTPPTPSIEPPTNPPVLNIDIKKLNLLIEEETKKRDAIDNDPAAEEDPPENITWIKPTEVEFNRLKKHFASHNIRLTDNCLNKLLNRGYTVEQVIDTADQVANRYHREGRTISCDCDYWFLHSVMSKVSPQNLTAQEMQRRHDAELEKLYPTLN